MPNIDLRSESIGGFIYRKALQLGKIGEIEDLLVPGMTENEADFYLKKFHENKGEYFILGFEKLQKCAQILGYETDPIHHEASWVTNMLKDFDNYRID